MRSYDAIFFTADRTVDEWLEVLNWAMQSTRKIVLYVHEDSEAFEPLRNLAISRAKIGYVKAVRGLWIVIESQRPEICRAYVCFHKPYYMPKLPDGYIKIHAGKKLSNIDLGSEFIGDDSGDNISNLNPFINELTATYWAWKNTRSDYVGFSHYSRYFVVPDDKSKPDSKNYVPLGYLPGGHILTMDEAIDLLKNCDIIVRNVSVFYSSYGDSFDQLEPNSVRKIGYDIFKKHISKQFPEYIPLLDEMHSGHFLIGNSVFFTRWKVFDEYCKWLFSFIIPAAREFASYNFETDRRIISYFGEDMFQLFVMHNNLRVKYVRMFAGGYESTEDSFDSRKFY